MQTVLVISNILLLVLAITLFLLFRSYQQRLYRLEGRKLRYPVPTVSLGEFDERFASTPLGPGLATEVHHIGYGDGVPGGASDAETWVLSVLARSARRMFEFGTCTGRTTYLWARNSPPDARVTTITLAPAQVESYTPGAGDTRRATRRAGRESSFTRFVYSGTDVEHKIEQLFGDSKELDETRYAGAFDLIFIDGSHAYSYVKSDTEKALRMLAPGGILLWHDYRGPFGDVKGVFRYLNELSRRLPLVHLRGTSLVAYQNQPSRQSEHWLQAGSSS